MHGDSNDDTTLPAESEQPTSHEVSPGGASTRMFRGHDPGAPPEVKGYKVLRKIGDGGMGIVYLAQREADRFQRTVALKVVKRGRDTDEILRRFELERQVLAALNHPNIARLIDGGVTRDGRPYFALEYIEGQSIDEYCDSHRLRTSERLELFVKICRAVHHAHKNLVVHRDIKPSNVLVTGDGTPKLLDFGIAKLINPDMTAGAVPPTAGALPLMTPEYASPEQVRNAPISTASDIYSLGVMLYELLTGHRPYHLRTRIQDELVRVICDEEPTRPSDAVTRVVEIEAPTTGQTKATTKITPEGVARARDVHIDRLKRKLRGDVDNIVLKAMRKAPQRRYESAEQFAQDIVNHLKGFPVVARPDSATYRFSKYVRRNRVGVALAGLVVVAGGLAIATGWATTRAELARKTANEAAALAETQRVVAERRSLTIQEILDVWLDEYWSSLKAIEGSTEARRLLADHALEKLAELEADGEASDPELRGQLAQAYSRVGEIQFSLRGTHVGDIEGSLASHRKALAMRETLPESFPGTVEGLIESHFRVADILRQTDPQTAQPHFDALEGLLSRTDDLTRRRQHVKLLDATAKMWADMPDGLSRAKELADQSLWMREANLTLAPPDDDGLRINLERAVGVGLSTVGGILVKSGKNEEAEPFYRRNLQIRQDLLAEMDHPSLRRDVLTARFTLANCLLGDDSHAADVIEILEPARADLELMVANDPDDRRVQGDLANTIEILGGAHRALGNDEEAGRLFREFFARSKTLHESDPADPVAKERLAGGHLHLARLHVAAGESAAGLDEDDHALGHLEPIIHLDPRIEKRVEEIRAEVKRLEAEIEAADQSP